MLLKQYEGKKKQNTGTRALPTDVCLRCKKLGHWAADCPEGHEPEWVANQVYMFLCGQQGHLKANCPKKQTKGKSVFNKPPAVKRLYGIMLALPWPNYTLHFAYCESYLL
jgi:hypothetical protein